ncbi:hypothetical protein [Apilactobacillus ozensis]|uniref:hypothetical protein n=1 Tax=Apilactobacillus ozensis TaxID=866801 RepID=UPI00200B3D78|nr:hypothetical protein [Apilactobacillus ozensis]MCK8607415.1 hypothetical protein [Apilactobacillus ozensis]
MIVVFLFCAVLGSFAGAIAKNNYNSNGISLKFNKKDVFKYLPITISIVLVLYCVSLFEY